MNTPDLTPVIEVEGLTARFGEDTIFEKVSFQVRPGEILVVLGGSGFGKSTLLKHLVGLYQPAAGRVILNGTDMSRAKARELRRVKMGMGVLFQSGALFGSMTLAENVALPLGEYTGLKAEQIRELASLKLALVGLAGFEEYYPSEISGGMRKRAGLARAMALDPEFLFLDEPSAGLDPVSSRLLDDLILELRESLGTTFIIVTHELASIFAIGNNAIYLDVETRTMTSQGDPKRLLEEGKDPKVVKFLTRGEKG